MNMHVPSIAAFCLVLSCPSATVAVAETLAAQRDTEPPALLLAESAELPRAAVDVTWKPLRGRTIVVRQGDNLQHAIDRAERGDTIQVDPQGQWPAIVLPAKPGEGWIHIQSAALASLPPADARVTFDDVGSMPTILNIVTGTPRPAFNTELRASHYRIMGLHFKSREYTGRGHNKLIMLGRGGSTILEATVPEELPHHIIFDRCVVEGWPGNTTRGLYLDGRQIAVIGCDIRDITSDQESHGILITDTPGPILIENNSIGASGVNIFIGDNNALRWHDVTAADITIRNNRLYKEAEWKASYGLKNHFEMKRGERVLFEHNACVYSPVDAQDGFSIKLKTGGHDQYVQDVVLRHNRIREANGYIAISNQDDTETVKRVLSYDNQCHCSFSNGVGILFRVDTGAAPVSDIAFVGDQVQGRELKALMTFSGRRPSIERLEYRGNRAAHGRYGVKGDGAQVGVASLQGYCRPSLFRGNILTGAGSTTAQQYPPGNRHVP